MLRSDLCDYSEAYIVVEVTITVEKAHNRDRKNRSLAFKNNASFISCISKINNTLIDNAEDLDIVMPMHNLLEYSKNYSKTTGSLWNYYRDEPNNPPINLVANPFIVLYDRYRITNSASFKYKSSIIGKTPNNDNDNNNKMKNVKIIVPLKHLSNFWKTLSMSLDNCEVSLILTRSKNCALTDLITHDAAAAQGDNPARTAIAAHATANATFKIKDTKLYVPVVTSSTQEDNKLLEQLKIGCERTIE